MWSIMLHHDMKTIGPPAWFNYPGLVPLADLCTFLTIDNILEGTDTDELKRRIKYSGLLLLIYEEPLLISER